ncbi:hypothetical protein LCGC14_0510910 [marine sediment metagenome]|uniref:Uncharacterized protein n=1 Tax=marine sediment metagenome TaxID=412755 RepID=A0A0F9S628_9ZZZZ
MRFVIDLGLCLAPASSALAHRIPPCPGGDRPARKVTCIVDGDTGWERGVKWRALDVDTLEISSPECAEEKRVGIKARDRLRELMGNG